MLVSKYRDQQLVIYLKVLHCSSQEVKQWLSSKKRKTHTHTRARGTDLQTVFEAVGRRLVAAVAVLLPALAQQQGPLVQEEVALHGLEASQLLHAGGAPLVAEPHTEGALHQHAAQLTNVALPGGKKGWKALLLHQFPPRPTIWTQSLLKDLVSRDGDLMHGVVD